MDKLRIESRNDTPEIIADGDNGLFEISGKSLPEDAIEFFKPLEDYVRTYIENPRSRTVVNLRPIYLNSSSSKKILDVIHLFEELQDSGAEVEVNWINTTGDQDIVDEGIEFTHMTSLHINFTTQNENY